jgi:hypothetical protein
MAAPLNKNSQYIQSLTDYILDTKPYHSKLTEIVEEYQFFDSMNVHFEERSLMRLKLDPTWLYNFYSGGDSSLRTVGLKQLHDPLKSLWPSNASSIYPGAIKVSRDENHDFASIPFVYSKKAFDGPGVADVLIERNGVRSTIEPLVEGLDWFQSHGSIQLQIKQTSDANTNFVPSWSETRDDNVISTASAITRQIANDLSNSNSAVSQVRVILTQIKTIIDAGMLANPTGPINSAYTQASNAYLALWAITSIPQLPQDYEALLNNLITASAVPMTPYTGWIGNDVGIQKFVSEKLSALSPAMYFNIFSDATTRESGKAEYSEVDSTWLTITTITTSALAVPGDTWKIVALNSTAPLWAVFSSINGYVGQFAATPTGTQFGSSTINFKATHLAQAPIDTTLRIRNRNRLVFGSSAPLETWNIIKVNPLAYSRPALSSIRYGYITSLTNVVGEITLIAHPILPLLPLPTGTIVLTFNGTTFDLTSTTESSYTGIVTVNVPFNDGRLGFTIHAGSVAGFQAGDKFYLDIVNDPAQALDLNLGYGYDLDSYDNQTIVDENGVALNFAYDTRFTDYNTDLMNMTIAQNAISGRSWRLRALPDLTHPIATLKKDGSGPSNWVDLQDATDGVAPDPASNAVPLYNMPSDIAPNLMLYRSTSFQVEWSDNGFNTVTSAGTIGVGNTFVSISHGIQFTLVAGNKPFICASSYDGVGPRVLGGDIFTFTVQNNDPYLNNSPIGLTAANASRLIMNGDGFHEAPAAQWTVAFTSTIDYTVSGILTEGTPGVQVDGGPWTGKLTTSGVLDLENTSFKRGGVHFTFVPGSYGLGAGDSFTFATFSRKPTYLVHGSVSGWKPEAVVGETYWNGIIGFVIEKPTAELFNVVASPIRINMSSPNVWGLPGGAISMTRLRFDIDSCVYSLIPTPITGTKTGWYVYHDTAGGVGHLPLNGSFSDTYVTLIADHIDVAGCVQLKLDITADDFAMWNAQDTVIVRPAIAPKLPTVNDFILVDKRTIDRLAINLDYDSVALPPSMAALAPETQDVHFIDTYTGITGLPLASTSPETAIVRNYIPLTLVPYDSNSSVAEFSDAATSYDIYALGSGQAIGTLTPTGADANWPMQLEWDLNFFAGTAYQAATATSSEVLATPAYLPLNASANIVTYGSGFNDNLNVRIRESIKFLVAGGALSTDFLFHDAAAVVVNDHADWTIFQALKDTVDIDVNDSPFGGFLPGYDNMPFDDEGGVGFYGVGLPTTDEFLEAKTIATLGGSLQRLAALTAKLQGFINGSVAATDLPFFLAALDATDAINYTPVLSGFGIPAVGMATDITIGDAGATSTNASTESATTGIMDALVVMIIDSSNTLEQFTLDIGGLDAQADRTALIYSGALPPVPSSPALSSYDEFETPLAVVGDPNVPTDFVARVFEVAFNITAANKASIIAMPNPKIFIWLPTWPNPQPIAVVDKVGVGRYRVSVPTATEAKLYLLPGP